MQPFSYVRAHTVDEAIRSHSDVGNGARLFAGGTTLYDLMKLGVEAPVIDITEIADLRRIECNSREIVFGALASMTEIAPHPIVKRDYGLISEALLQSASEQLRAMATIGGNLLQRTRCAYFRGGASFPCNKRALGLPQLTKKVRLYGG